MNNDRIVILAAGSSSRMNKSLGGGAGERMTKCMIPVGTDEKPFLEYLLGNVEKAGFRQVVLVTAVGDDSIEQHFHQSFGTLTLSRVVQTVPPGRQKPAGTADALLQVLKARPDWAGKNFSVCNSDNLYSADILEKLRTSTSPNTMPCYRRDCLRYPEDRTGRFAVITLSENLQVQKIIEKPTLDQIEESSPDGIVYVSMNLFKLDFDIIQPVLEKIPFDPERNEKELPVAVAMMLFENPGCMQGIPVCEHVPDLTSAEDISMVSSGLI